MTGDLCYVIITRCFYTGCTAKTSTVTEESMSNTPNHIPYIANLSQSQPITTDRSRKKRSKKKMKLDAKKSLLTTIKEPESNTISYNYQFCENPDTEESPSKRLKTEESVSFKDHQDHQDHPYGDIVLWERPGDHAQSILEISAAVSGMALMCKYSKIQEKGW